MMNNEFENITLEELYRKCQPLSDEQKEKVTELCDKGWVDVADAYYDYCKERNYDMFLLDNEKLQRYKNNEPLTKEQEIKCKKLVEMDWKDVARAYTKVCEEENYTEVYKAALRRGHFEGSGFNICPNCDIEF